MKNYDAVIIGSGMGGLTTASLLSRIGKLNVLVIEKHGKLGGFTHCFLKQNKFLFDAGIHYVGDMHEGSKVKKWMDFVTFGEVEWLKFPRIFQKFVYPSKTISVSSNQNDYINELINNFPEHEKSIKKYFKSVKKIAQFNQLFFFEKLLPQFLKTIYKDIIFRRQYQMAKMKTQDFLNQFQFSDQLKAVLDSQFGDYGLPSNESSVFIHALIVSHYLQGAYFPKGGGRSISQAIKKNLEDRGSEFLLHHEVLQIKQENNQVIGVLVRDLKNNQDFFVKSQYVISNVGAYNTYLKLLKDQNFPFLNILKDLKPASSFLDLYIGFKAFPKNLGFTGENNWIFNNYDHQENMDQSHSLVDFEVKMAFMSMPSLLDEQCEYKTAQILVPIRHEHFELWKESSKKSRPDEYLKIKKSLEEKIILFLKNKYPDLVNLIEFYELGTPLTFTHYSSHPFGQIYSIPFRPDRIDYEFCQVQTPIKNLFLTGADVATLGVAGALSSGVLSATKILGLKKMKKILN